MSERQKINEYQKLIEKNQVLADYIRSHDLTDVEIKELKLKTEGFFIEVLRNKALRHAIIEEIYTHLRSL